MGGGGKKKKKFLDPVSSLFQILEKSADHQQNSKQRTAVAWASTNQHKSAGATCVWHHNLYDRPAYSDKTRRLIIELYFIRKWATEI